MKGKEGAMELSIGTIVIIVLAMSMLILGLILVRNIFSGANDITSMTNEQVKNQIKELFGNNAKLAIYPDTKHIEVEQGEVTGFGLGIKNDYSDQYSFRYEVIVSDPDLQTKCNVNEQEVLRWIQTGRSEDNIALSPGQFSSAKVLLQVPEGSALCTFRLRVNVFYDQGTHASEAVDVTVVP